MSGHSKWATIKRKKGALDAKRGALFSKLIREITVAAKTGGDDLDSNFRLRTAVLKARENNMPNDNIERAIKKAVGASGEGNAFEEIRYEGYGPGGVAIMVDTLTDNKKRTTPEIRTIFSKSGGNLGDSGSVAYMFERKGEFVIESGQTTEDEMMELLLDKGVEDIKDEGGNILIYTSPDDFHAVYDLLKSKNLKLASSEISFIPKTSITLDEKRAQQCMTLVDNLENQEDVQNVYSNYDIPDDIMAKIGEAQ